VFAVLPTDHGLARSRRSVGTICRRDLHRQRRAPGPEIRDYLVQRLADLGHIRISTRKTLGAMFSYRWSRWPRAHRGQRSGDWGAISRCDLSADRR
jgi:hypothetical protein